MEMENLTEKAKEAVENALGLNDTSADARLYLNGKEYPVDNFDMMFQQSVNRFSGEPERGVKGGLLSIDLNQVTDEQLNYWMFHREVYYSGSVVFGSFSNIANPVIVVEFSEGRLAKFDKVGDSSLALNILITARKIKVNSLEHTNNPSKNK